MKKKRWRGREGWGEKTRRFSEICLGQADGELNKKRDWTQIYTLHKTYTVTNCHFRQKADVHFMADARARCDIYSSEYMTASPSTGSCGIPHKTGGLKVFTHCKLLLWCGSGRFCAWWVVSATRVKSWGNTGDYRRVYEAVWEVKNMNTIHGEKYSPTFFYNFVYLFVWNEILL